ncbi:hypothetical protein [Hydrogenophaga sp.]|uniref:hypothetical protein n=1 Tax=Hydrogenophaga sp. TaxID=1904254 RepID=UPI0026310F2A|nr:hypothetical protein [Hydrogenophaga sp.]MCW5654546.1 hypothetical protein [Hydrogenophaga sp.]
MKNKLCIAAALLALAGAGHAQTSPQQNPCDALQGHAAFECRMNRNNEAIRNLGKSQGGGNECAACPEACEMVCSSNDPNLAKCQADLREYRRQKLAACRAQGRL